MICYIKYTRLVIFQDFGYSKLVIIPKKLGPTNANILGP